MARDITGILNRGLVFGLVLFIVGCGHKEEAPLPPSSPNPSVEQPAEPDNPTEPKRIRPGGKK
jgi:hypothetical protein